LTATTIATTGAANAGKSATAAAATTRGQAAHVRFGRAPTKLASDRFRA
jgi:hypothetical protein